VRLGGMVLVVPVAQVVPVVPEQQIQSRGQFLLAEAEQGDLPLTQMPLGRVVLAEEEQGVPFHLEQQPLELPIRVVVVEVRQGAEEQLKVARGVLAL